MILTFSSNPSGGPVFVSCHHKDAKNIMAYLIRIIKDLDIKRPNMLIKKDESDWKLKILSISKKDLDILKELLHNGKYKFNGNLMEFVFEESYE